MRCPHTHDRQHRATSHGYLQGAVWADSTAKRLREVATACFLPPEQVHAAIAQLLGSAEAEIEIDVEDLPGRTALLLAITRHFGFEEVFGGEDGHLNR